MDEKVISILKDKPVVIPRILLNNYKKLNISDSELIIIMVLLSFGDKITYNPEEFAKEINGDKHQVMNIINNLIHKNIISLEIERVNKKANEYLSLDLLYDKLFNLIIDKKEEKEIDISIFDTFEKELGRTLSPMEYGQIQEWITSGNSEEMIACALREAVLNGVSNLRYIDSILNDWKKKGYKNKNDVLKDREMYRNKKNKVSVYDTDWLNE
ncbi:MAG: DnaD domain protein [Bacilli bacterium]